MLRKIDGSDPSIRVASISHFFDNTLNLHLEDPDEIDSNAVDFEISGGEDQFLKYYYRPFVSLIERSGTSHEEAIDRRTDFIRIGNRGINIVSLAEVDLVVGLDAQVQEILTLGFQERDARQIPIALDPSSLIILRVFYKQPIPSTTILLHS